MSSKHTPASSVARILVSGVDWAGFNVSTNTVSVIWETVLQVKRPNQQYLHVRRYKVKYPNPEKANNTKYSDTINRDTYKPLVYNNTMGWLGDGSHRGQGCQAWTAVGLAPQYPLITDTAECYQCNLKLSNWLADGVLGLSPCAVTYQTVAQSS